MEPLVPQEGDEVLVRSEGPLCGLTAFVRTELPVIASCLVLGVSDSFEGERLWFAILPADSLQVVE